MQTKDSKLLLPIYKSAQDLVSCNFTYGRKDSEMMTRCQRVEYYHHLCTFEKDTCIVVDFLFMRHDVSLWPWKTGNINMFTDYKDNDGFEK